MMRQWMTVAVLTLAAFATPGRADTVVPSDRVRNAVNVRAEPMGDPSPVVGKLRPGEDAEFLGAVPHYFHVRLPGGPEGFVSKSWTRLVTAGAPPPSDNQFRLAIHFIDVGQGDSTLVACPDGTNILVDAGSKPQTVTVDALRDYIFPFLDRNGERKLETLVVTHPDEDHYNLLMDTLEGISIDRIYQVGAESDYADEDVWEWLRGFGSSATTLPASFFDHEAEPNPDIDCGGADVWIMAAAVESSFSRKNTMSIVLMIRFGDFEAIMTGDATRVTEETIIDRYSAGWLDADVLKIGHHGSLTTSTTDEWAEAIRPQLAVASAGRDNNFGHPRREVVERLEPFTMDGPAHPMLYWTGTLHNYTAHQPDAYVEAVYSTGVNGHVVITTDGSGFDVTTTHWDE